MKRFHVHVAVNDLSESIAFYSAMFGEEPAVVENDYAKWMLEDPRVNFAISDRGGAPGVNHLGVQAEDSAELEAIHANLQKADTMVQPEIGAHCCYAKSDKYWVTDPQGIAWESFHSLGSIPLFGSAVSEPSAVDRETSCGSSEVSSCCAPTQTKVADPTRGAGGCCAKA
jgi:glyoxalase/bleomycin resistance protein/dioxygenase superfamily protein